MTARVELYPDAQAEIGEAVGRYDRQAAGVGRILLADLHRLIGRIARYPNAYPRFKAGVRRASLARFPYQLFYLPGGARIIVIAVMHLHRDGAGVEQQLAQRHHL